LADNSEAQEDFTILCMFRNYLNKDLIFAVSRLEVNWINREDCTTEYATD
jgi:hypothetical protein